MRRIVHRCAGRRHGPILRLVSPGDLGAVLKPFVFLDLFEVTQGDGGFGMHPHSGIATVTYVMWGDAVYEAHDLGDDLGLEDLRRVLRDRLEQALTWSRIWWLSLCRRVVAPCSWWQVTNLTGLSRSASITSMFLLTGDAEDVLDALVLEGLDEESGGFSRDASCGLCK